MPDHLYETTDYRRFISNALERRGVTRRQFAEIVSRSTAYVSLVLSGSRRLDPELVIVVARFLGLDDDQRSYLAALVDLDSKSERGRRAARALVQARQLHHEVSQGFTADVMAVMERWYVSAILELVACDGFRPDPAWIAHTLCPPITVEEAEEALSLLERQGMIEPDEAGGWRQRASEHWSPSDLLGRVAQSARRAHRATLALAAEGLGRFQHNERYIGTCTVAITEERYQLLMARMKQVLLELADMSEDPTVPPNRVYHLSMQLFPLSLFTDTEYEPGAHEAPAAQVEPLPQEGPGGAGEDQG